MKIKAQKDLKKHMFLFFFAANVKKLIDLNAVNAKKLVCLFFS